MQYDYIVVGGGSAGCVAAARLVRDFGARVLLLEAGLGDGNPLIRIPAGFSKLMTPRSRYYTHHWSVPQEHLGGRSVPIMQSRVLGGGSALNAMTYMRGTRADYDRWDAMLGGGGWSWQGMLPYFIRQEANQRLGAPYHGVDGPLPVSDPHHPISTISRAFVLALQDKGLPYTTDFNAGSTRGVGILQSTTFMGERWSAARAFLGPLRNSPQLSIRLRARVVGITFDRDRAVGVEYVVGESRHVQRARCNEEVILSAGCFSSAHLLLLSAIGSADDLRKHSIAVRAHVPGVGQGIQDHNDARIAVRTHANDGYSGEDCGWRMLRNGLQYALFNSGPATSTGSEVTAFINPSDFHAEPTVQFYCLGRITGRSGGRPPVGATLVANLIAPKSRGTMRLASADPAVLPLIDPNWLSDPDDLRHLAQGVRFLLETSERKPLGRRIAQTLEIQTSASDRDIEEYCKRVTGTNWHPVGSCRMGRAYDTRAVVDTELRVRGVSSLRVFDGSIMPTIVGANTNAPIMAIADRGVDLMMGVQSPHCKSANGGSQNQTPEFCRPASDSHAAH